MHNVWQDLLINLFIFYLFINLTGTLACHLLFRGKGNQTRNVVVRIMNSFFF